jgi:dephospho-CoA kinase
MQRIALTGGIGAGKSAAARRFAELGAVVIDSDELVRQAEEPGTQGLAQIVAMFGPHVLAADGTLDRAALGARVFGDSDALHALEAIIHPQVRALSAAREAAAEAAGEKVVIHDIPLLVETGRAGQFDEVIVVEAPVELRVSRLVSSRGMSLEAARARVAAQVSDDERRAVATVLLDGTGTVEHLNDQVDAYWASLAGVQ